MPSRRVAFTGLSVALIVRGKESAEHSPSKLAQHADCVRSDGSPVGYFSRDGAGSGFLSAATLLGVDGKVYGLEEFRKNRPFYIDWKKAKAYNVVSTALVVTVSSNEAQKFDAYWDQLTKDPGTFRLIGKNCSTRASGAFRHAGILAGGIPGMDTPNNLYKQIKAEVPHRCHSYSGYIGVELVGNHLCMRVEEVKD